MNLAIRWLPALLGMAAIFFLSHQTGDELNTFLPLFQKLFPAMESFDGGHFAAYFTLALCYYWALLPRSFSMWGKVLVIVLCLAYGVTDEYHQSFVADRTPDAGDLRNDGIGAALAMLLVSVPSISSPIRKRFHS